MKYEEEMVDLGVLPRGFKVGIERAYLMSVEQFDAF